ncbi:zf-TFIIB domain-containing protein [Aminobacter aganoensis]|uniref:Recombination protein RecR n=1 Tax=Rhizobium rosettiformans W3 TaxID=538378 RepID=A0A4V4HQ60_9HYPH|nr:MULTISPECIES: zf-TFIIB domain-containing protein [Hyphomicrobiales]EAB6717795.1 recombination protein RecR [Salmonella enterica subsp. enterica]EBX4816716.1 recombination protein RecR [Salmonella enterica subsp. enterica serovar Newport]ECI7685915.1 recombination protein RecR [Salmonella enterica subsp. enterica serovar Paratyphi A]EFG6100825.1 recombination protein RecR [Escherichia coli]MIL09391.1 recombination protein RecR [Salmonella enterica subsp. enterica serovar Enteritidis]
MLLNSQGPSNQAASALCPHCRIDLVMSERQGIEIDYCPKCRGVWLDRGELDKIIERSAAEDTRYGQVQAGRGRSQASPRDAQSDCREDHRRDYSDHDRHGGHHGRRHGSFLGRLFD